jgi:formylmethanofuran--tetrahydromethanopterin N-formyltransferase
MWSNHEVSGEAAGIVTDPRVEDTFAEAFEMKFARLIVTAADSHWLEMAARAFCGYGTSVIGCDAECGVESYLAAAETDDGRTGVSILIFSFSTEGLESAVVNRTGQCLMTCPTTAVYNGFRSDRELGLGKKLRFFGDGFQKSKLLGNRRFWRVPVMDGEFVVEETIGAGRGIAGGNIIIAGKSTEAVLNAARVSVVEIGKLPGCITPFPGGVARSGSKVGSRYKGMIASTNEAFCPSLRGRVPLALPEEAGVACEIVIDGTSEDAVRAAMRAAIIAALNSGGTEIVSISAGNYGGKLGKCLIPLRSL